jgi:hypothetical protein
MAIPYTGLFIAAVIHGLVTVGTPGRTERFQVSLCSRLCVCAAGYWCRAQCQKKKSVSVRCAALRGTGPGPSCRARRAGPRCCCQHRQTRSRSRAMSGGAAFVSSCAQDDTPMGWWLGLHQPPWSFGFDSQTRGTRENRRTLY